MRFRMTITGLLVLVLCAGLSIAALLKASALWTIIVYNLTLALFTVAGLGALFSRRRPRAFCAGLVFTGLVYLLAVVFSDATPGLLTTFAMESLYERLFPPPAQPGGATPGAQPGAASPVAPAATGEVRYEWKLVAVGPLGPTPDKFRAIGHLLTATLLGIGGGAIACSLYGRAKGANRHDRAARA